MPVPADRGPGKKWTQGPEVAPAAPETNGVPIRIGYARCSTATQELQSQLDALAAAKCTRVFSEKISTRIRGRPEFEAALALAREIKTAAPDQPVILTVHEMKRLARNVAELMTLSATSQATGIQLELLSGPLTGIYDPHGMGSMLFARALRDKGTPMPDIFKKLTIKTGKNAGDHPSVASLYRALADTAPDQALPEHLAGFSGIPAVPQVGRPRSSGLHQALFAPRRPRAVGAGWWWPRAVGRHCCQAVRRGRRARCLAPAWTHQAWSNPVSVGLAVRATTTATPTADSC
ncbi:recombinase family protein [Nonomuraea sp. NEAU-A123]|uniref:recombinase family protein n=1 Tax=Nonomuraea sp. NEAU-A123 TaxID=2839649 RepID=UPI0027E106A5|nr:recombinase family protein [Nonomuraea sp. NEAU-A123]